MRKFMAAALAAVLMSGVAQAEPPSTSDARTLEALMVGNDRAWDAGDAEAISADYAQDGTLRLGEGRALEGRAAVRGYFVERFAARVPGMRHVSRLERAEMIGPDMALTDAHVSIERDGKALRTFRTYSLVVRDGGRWRIKAVRAQPIG